MRKKELKNDARERKNRGLSAANANVLRLAVNRTIEPFYIIADRSITFPWLMKGA